MDSSSPTTSQSIRQQRLLAELQINGMIPKSGIIERIGDSANTLTETIMTALNGLGGMTGAEKAMDSSRRAVMAETQNMGRKGAILIAADHVAKQRGDTLSFNQGGIPDEGHVALATEYLERALAEHKATSQPDHFRNMVASRTNQTDPTRSPGWGK